MNLCCLVWMVDLTQCRITWKGGLSEQLSRLAWSVGMPLLVLHAYLGGKSHSECGHHWTPLHIHHILLTVLRLVLSGSCHYALSTFVRVFLSTTTESETTIVTITSAWEGREGQILGAHWPASLVNWWASGSAERPCLKKSGGEWPRRILEVHLWPCAWTDMCACTHAHNTLRHACLVWGCSSVVGRALGSAFRLKCFKNKDHTELSGKL